MEDRGEQRMTDAVWSDSDEARADAACVNADCDAVISVGWEQVGKTAKCPKCATTMRLEYDETYDAETNEEDSWWFFERPDE